MADNKNATRKEIETNRRGLSGSDEIRELSDDEMRIMVGGYYQKPQYGCFPSIPKTCDFTFYGKPEGTFHDDDLP